MQLLWAVLGYLQALGVTAVEVMRLRFSGLPTDYPWALPIGVAVVGGISVMAGQSAILAINRVHRWRGVLTMAVSGMLSVVGAGVQSLIAWGLARLTLDAPPSLGQIFAAVMLSMAPYWWGVLIVLPWSGPMVARALEVWQLVVVWKVLTVVCQVDPLVALPLAATAWLGLIAINLIVDRSGLHLRARIFRVVSGTAWVEPADLMEGQP